MGPGVDLSLLTDLAGLTFPAVDLSGASFYGSDLSGADLSAVTSFAGTDFTGVDLHGADLQGVDLTGDSLSGIHSGDLTGTPAALPTGWAIGAGYLMGPGVDLSFNTDLAGLTFPAVDLSGASFYGADLSGADLSAVTSFAGTDFTGVDLHGADLQGVDLTGDSLSGIHSGDLTGTPAALPTGWAIGAGYLMGPGVDLSFNTDLAGLTFPAVDLSGASFYGADLSGADLSAVTSFAGADMAGVTWSNTTCPDHSNSDTNGSSPDSCIGHGI